MVFEDESGGLGSIDSVSQIDVHENQVYVLGCIDRLYRLLSGGSGSYSVSVFLERFFRVECDQGFIFYEQQGFLRGFRHIYLNCTGQKIFMMKCTL